MIVPLKNFNPLLVYSSFASRVAHVDLGDLFLRRGWQDFGRLRLEDGAVAKIEMN
jgi:hypothetical protein